MSYRVQIEMPESAPLKDKVLLHAKFIQHFQRRKLDAGARGRTQWAMEFSSEKERFTIIWSRNPGTVNGMLRFRRERLMGLVVLKFSKKDIEIGGTFIVTGDWAAIEDFILQQERVA